MGEIAEMMLEGAMCQFCGEYLGGGDGFPQSCYSCTHEQKRNEKCEKILINIENFSQFLRKNEVVIKKHFAPNGNRLIKAVHAFLLNAKAKGM